MHTPDEQKIIKALKSLLQDELKEFMHRDLTESDRVSLVKKLHLIKTQKLDPTLAEEISMRPCKSMPGIHIEFVYKRPKFRECGCEI